MKNKTTNELILEELNNRLEFVSNQITKLENNKLALEFEKASIKNIIKSVIKIINTYNESK